MERYRYAAVGQNGYRAGVMVLAASAGYLFHLGCNSTSPLAHGGTRSSTWRGESLISVAPHSNDKISHWDSRRAKVHANILLTEAIRGVGAMKALQTTCIVGLIASMVLYLAGGNTPVGTMPDVLPEAAANASAAALYAEASAKLAIALRAESGSVTSAGLRPLMAAAEITDYPTGPKLASLDPQDIAHPSPTARDASDDIPKSALSTQDFRYLIYYVWSELPPAEKPAQIVLRSLKDIPVGTPVDEIKRAADAFGLDSNFMKAVAKIESGFNPNQRTGSYIGLFQLSKYEFGKFGFGEIRSPRDNAVAARWGRCNGKGTS